MNTFTFAYAMSQQRSSGYVDCKRRILQWKFQSLKGCTIFHKNSRFYEESQLRETDSTLKNMCLDIVSLFNLLIKLIEINYRTIIPSILIEGFETKKKGEIVRQTRKNTFPLNNRRNLDKLQTGSNTGLLEVQLCVR